MSLLIAFEFLFTLYLTIGLSCYTVHEVWVWWGGLCGKAASRKRLKARI